MGGFTRGNDECRHVNPSGNAIILPLIGILSRCVLAYNEQVAFLKTPMDTRFERGADEMYKLWACALLSKTFRGRVLDGVEAGPRCEIGLPEQSRPLEILTGGLWTR
jgi:hypothetical protein